MIFKSINNQKKKNILIIIQLTIAFFILFLVFALIEENMQTFKRSQAVINSNLYNVMCYTKGLTDNYDPMIDSFHLTSEVRYNLFNTTKSFSETLKLLKSDSRIKSIGKSYSDWLASDEFNSTNQNYLHFSSTKYRLLVACNDDTADVYHNYKIIKGKNFSDYSSNDKEKNIIPILIGPDLEKSNPIGSVVEIPECTNTDTSKPYKFKVIGILSPFYPTLAQITLTGSNSIENGGYVVVIPKLTIYNDVLKLNYNNIFVELKNRNDADKIGNEYSKKLGMCDVSLGDISSDFKSSKDTSLCGQIGMLVYGIAALILSCFGIISISLSTFVKRTKEIGIRIAVGAKKVHIIVLLAGEYTVLLLSSGVVSLLAIYLASNLIKIGENKLLLIDLHTIAAATLSVIIFSIIGLAPLIYQIFKLNAIELIKAK